MHAAADREETLSVRVWGYGCAVLGQGGPLGRWFYLLEVVGIVQSH